MDALLDLHGHPALSAELSAWLDRMADEYRRAKACAAQTVAAFESAAARACEFARRIDMRFLYLRDAQVLILDEPTAALDAVAEAEVFANFAQLTRERMAILISHRFSTVRLADRIVVLSGGRITEDGRHDELIASRGQYARLFEIQAANYR